MEKVEKTSIVTIESDVNKVAIYNKLHNETEDEIVITFTFVEEVSESASK